MEVSSLEFTIDDLLNNPDNFDWADEVFILSSEHINAKSQVYVLDIEDSTNSNKLDDIIGRGFKRFLSVAQIQDVVSNLEQQYKAATIEQRISSLQYYCKNDSFISLV